MIEFLPFGNVSVAFLILLGAAFSIATLYWLFTSTLNFMLNADHDNAKVKIDTKKVFGIFRKTKPACEFYKVTPSKDRAGYYVISHLLYGTIYDCDDDCFYHREWSGSRFPTKQLAEDYMKEKLITGTVTQLFYFPVLTCAIDVVIWLFPMAPTFVTTVIILGCVVFGVRKLSGYLWSNISTTDDHETRISKLEENK